MKLPACARVGVQLNVLLTGFPVVGSGGVIAAPVGSPTTFSVTTSPASTSDAVAWKLTAWPVFATTVEPHVGELNDGVWFTMGTSWMKKSTAIFDLTAFPAVRSSMVTCVE
jgi:hypothetical protein